MADDIILEVDGREYGGWKTASVTRSIEQIAGTFSVGVSELWPGSPLRREIGPGARCTVAIGGEVVITGWVDGVDLSYDAGNHEVSISGRDATGDLVDCAALHEPGQWHGRTLEQIAADLCAPFGVGVTAEVATAPFPDFKLQEGESVFGALERGARMRAVLLRSDGRGNLIIGRAGGARAPVELALGENVLAGKGAFSHQDRFSLYVVKGQQAGSDEVYGEQAAAVKGTATDPGVQRYRPLIVNAEDQADGVSATDRARWEAGVRAGRARKVTYTVQGWRHGGGLWQPNSVVRVRDEWIAIASELLIASVTSALDEGGQITSLDLVRPEAFALIELKARGKKSKAGKGGAAWGEELDEDIEEAP